MVIGGFFFYPIPHSIENCGVDDLIVMTLGPTRETFHFSSYVC